MSDNTILLGIIAVLNTVYVLLLVSQNRELKKWTEKMEKFIIEFTVLKTQHGDCKNCNE